MEQKKTEHITLSNLRLRSVGLNLRSGDKVLHPETRFMDCKYGITKEKITRPYYYHGRRIPTYFNFTRESHYRSSIYNR